MLITRFESAAWIRGEAGKQPVLLVYRAAPVRLGLCGECSPGRRGVAPSGSSGAFGAAEQRAFLPRTIVTAQGAWKALGQTASFSSTESVQFSLV